MLEFRRLALWSRGWRVGSAVVWQGDVGGLRAAEASRVLRVWCACSGAAGVRLSGVWSELVRGDQ